MFFYQKMLPLVGKDWFASRSAIGERGIFYVAFLRSSLSVVNSFVRAFLPKNIATGW
jgi:hypothetical protein